MMLAAFSQLGNSQGSIGQTENAGGKKRRAATYGMIHLHMVTALFYTTGQILEPAASLV